MREAAGEGTADRVAAMVSYALGAGQAVERLSTASASGTAAIALTGNALPQFITGNAGANRINGKAGSDTLTGGAGADRFVFSASTGAANIDRITDFDSRFDLIVLENAVFRGLSPGTLATGAFRSNTTGYAMDGTDRITYERDTGYLFFDADGAGTGGRVRFATLTAGLALTFADIVVI